MTVLVSVPWINVLVDRFFPQLDESDVASLHLNGDLAAGEFEIEATGLLGSSGELPIVPGALGLRCGDGQNTGTGRLQLSWNWAAAGLWPDFGGVASVADALRVFVDSAPGMAERFIEMFVRNATSQSDPTQALQQALGSEFASIVNSPDPLQALNQYGGVSQLYDSLIGHIAGSRTLSQVLMDTLAEIVGVGNVASFEDLLTRLLVPDVAGLLKAEDVYLAFTPNVLRPVTADVNDPGGGTRIALGSPEFRFGTDLDFELRNVPTDGFTLPQSWIGSTGLSIEANGVKPKLRAATVWPELQALGLPGGEKGVYMAWAGIGLPEAWTKNQPGGIGLGVEKAFIGTGGFTGTVKMYEPYNTSTKKAAPAAAGALWEGKVGGFQVKLSKFEADILANSLTSCDIAGQLTIPAIGGGTATPVNIEVAIDGKGGFTVTGRPPQGQTSIKTLDIGQLATLDIKTVALGKVETQGKDRFYLDLAGSLVVKTPGTGVPLVKTTVERLRVYSDGKFEFVGGVSLLLEKIDIEVGPAKVSVSAINTGTHQNGRKPGRYAYLGFDGSLSTGNGAVDARGTGIKLHCPMEKVLDGGVLRDPKLDDMYFTIDGLSIALMIPATADPKDAALILKGYISKKADPKYGDVYAGGIAFSIPKVNLTGYGAMMLMPKRPAWAVDIGIELAQAIPVAQNIGIYAARGMVGKNFLATKQAAGLSDENTWWEYYKAKPLNPPPNEGVALQKMDAAKDGFSIGLGASLCTVSDGGKAFSTKLFIYLGLPHLFMLQGQAAINAERLSLDDKKEPPFSALVVIDKTSITANLGVNYPLPAEGADKARVLKLNALAEVAFFFNNPSAWYVHLGTDKNPVTGSLIRLGSDPAAKYLFEAYAYLMLNHYGIRMGAGASFKFERQLSLTKKDGKKAKRSAVSVSAGAQIDWASQISWGAPPQDDPRPKPQVGASIGLAGYASVKVLAFKVSVGLSAALAGEGPKPFQVSGSLAVWVETDFKDFELKVAFEWVFDDQPDQSEVHLIDSKEVELKSPSKAVSVASGETFDVKFGTDLAAIGSALTNSSSAYVVPLDARIDLELAKPIKSNALGLSGPPGNNTESFPPQKGKSKQVEHTYTVTSAEMKIRGANGAWEPYDPYDANLPEGATSTLSATPPIGYWQVSAPKRVTKLSLLAETPLEFLTAGHTPVSPQSVGVEAEDIFCLPAVIDRQCAHLDVELDSIGDTYGQGDSLLRNNLTMHVAGGDASVLDSQHAGVERALAVQGAGGEAVFTFPKDVVDVEFTAKALNEDALVEYQTHDGTSYSTVSSESLPAGPARTLFYKDSANPISRIRVTSGGDCAPTTGSGKPTIGTGTTTTLTDTPTTGTDTPTIGTGTLTTLTGTPTTGTPITPTTGTPITPTAGTPTTGTPTTGTPTTGTGGPTTGTPITPTTGTPITPTTGTPTTGNGTPTTPTTGTPTTGTPTTPMTGTPTTPTTGTPTTGTPTTPMTGTPTTPTTGTPTTGTPTTGTPTTGTPTTPMTGTPTTPTTGTPTSVPGTPTSIPGTPTTGTPTTGTPPTGTPTTVDAPGTTIPEAPSVPDWVAGLGAGVAAGGAIGFAWLLLGADPGCPFVLHEARWPGGLAHLTPEDELGATFEPGQQFARDGMTWEVLEGRGSVLGLPGPGRDRGFAVWGPEGEGVFSLAKPTNRLELVVATFLEFAIVEFQALQDGAYNTVHSYMLGIAECPTTLTYDKPEQPIDRVRVTFAGDCSVTQGDIEAYLDRLKELEVGETGND